MREGEYFYYDDLKYETEEWKYCTLEDRRFNSEIHNGKFKDSLYSRI